ncbi:MAG: lipoyl(octanoyl) transferase LipB [Bacteroidetes bacterium]|nr:lipoyl(octanoyl) transferase LipB [Bacteroidota bacterium]
MPTAVKKPTVKFLDWGLVRYQEAWERQDVLLTEGVVIKTNNRKFPDQPTLTPKNYLVFCEHPHVYTLGKSGSLDNLLLSEAQLAEKGIDFFKINRGGDITYHGPGQIVGYPIFDLEQFRPDIHEYLRKMEESCIQTLAEYGIESGRIDGLTGVWLDVDGPNPRKIMAIGVRCSRWITMHGFAFNVNTDLSLFDNIIPCGIDDKGVTSIAKELGHAVDIEEVKEKMKAHMADLYGFEWE